MLLLEFPPELLLHILHHLGRDFFCEDVSRLAVCKRWFEIAWEVLVTDLRLTEKSLPRFATNEAGLARISPYLRSIELDLMNLECGKKCRAPDKWKHQMHAGFPALVAKLQECEGLRSLKLRSGPEAAPSPSLSAAACALYLGQPLLDILSLQNLTSLEVDAAGPCLLGGFLEYLPHLCVALNSLMCNSPSLKRLHCRMDMVCERLLEVPHTLDHPCFNRNLDEVVVMLSFAEISNECLICRHSKPCASAGKLDLTSLRTRLEQQASIFARRMHKPKMVRIIRRALPSLDLLVFDALTESRLRLDFISKWDDHSPSKPLEDDGDFPPPESTPVAIYYSGE